MYYLTIDSPLAFIIKCDVFGKFGMQERSILRLGFGAVNFAYTTSMHEPIDYDTCWQIHNVALIP